MDHPDTWSEVIRSLLRNKKLKKRIILAFTLVVVGVFCIVQYSVWRTSQDIPTVEKDLNSFMISYSKGDYNQAYEHFSNKYKKEADFETFKKASVQMRQQYSGYEANSLVRIGFTTRYYFSKPRELYYAANFTYNVTREIGELNVVYQLEDNKWRLYGVEISPPQY